MQSGTREQGELFVARGFAALPEPPTGVLIMGSDNPAAGACLQALSERAPSGPCQIVKSTLISERVDVRQVDLTVVGQQQVTLGLT